MSARRDSLIDYRPLAVLFFLLSDSFSRFFARAIIICWTPFAGAFVVRHTLPVTAVRLHLPGAAAVGGVEIEDCPEFPGQSGRFHRAENLHPRLQVPLHGVGRGDEVFFVAAVAEVVDARMLQKAADDADDADVLRQAGDAGAEPAGIPHEQIDLHPCHGGAIERLDHVAVLKGVHLELDEPAALFPLHLDFPLNPLQQPLFQHPGRRHQFGVIAFVHEAGGQVVEQLRDILADVYGRR